MSEANLINADFTNAVSVYTRSLMANLTGSILIGASLVDANRDGATRDVSNPSVAKNST